MGEFTDVSLGFPTVVFGGMLVVVVGFWAAVLVGVADAHGPGHHGAGGGGHHGGHGGHGGGHGHGGAGHGGARAAARGPHTAPAATGSHGAAAPGGHPHTASAQNTPHADAGLIAALGLDGVPVMVVLSLLVALGWFLSLAGSAALDGAGVHGPVRAAASVALLVAAAVGAWLATWVLVRPLRRLYPYEVPPSREDFVGRIGVIRTGSVTDRFGQAEVAAPDGSTAVVQVRQTGTDAFVSGAAALLYGYDPEGEFFWAAPSPFSSLDEPADAPPGRPGGRST